MNALLFWYGGTKLIGTGEYTVQKFFICYIAIAFSAQGAGSLFSYAPEIAGAREAATSLKHMLTSVPKIESSRLKTQQPEQPPVQGEVDLKDVTFAYPLAPSTPLSQTSPFLLDVASSSPLSEPAGAGRARSLASLERFFDPSSGKIVIDNTDLREFNLSSYRKEVALVEQESVLIGDSIRDCLISDDETVSDALIETACKAANIHEFVGKLLREVLFPPHVS